MFELLDRCLIAFFCGYFLCLSGSLSQLTTGNNLSSPSTLGFTGLGVLSTLGAFFLKNFFDMQFDLEYISLTVLIVLSGFIIAFVKKKKIHNVKNLILLGIGFNLFVGAVFSVVNFVLISKGTQFPSSIWFGNFKYVSTESIYIFLFLFILTKKFVRTNASKLEIMNLGDLFAKNLNIKTNYITLSSLFLSLVLTSIIVIFFGVFSFVGLVMPHILRAFPIFKYSVRKELTYGPYLSGLILLVLDQICYEFTINGAELPVGMLSTIFGSLSLIILLLSSGKESH